MARFKLNWDLLAAFFMWLVIIVVIVFAANQARASSPCGHFFKQPIVYAAPVAAVPYIYHNASPDLVAESRLRKAIREELQAHGALQQRQSVRQQQTAPSAFAKCISCHSGNNARGGLALDGATAITCHTYWRWGEMAGIGKDVPPAMKKLLDSMTPEEKGAVNTEMLNRGEADKPPPLPAPVGQLE